jgi:hypothetical protein
LGGATFKKLGILEFVLAVFTMLVPSVAQGKVYYHHPRHYPRGIITEAVTGVRTEVMGIHTVEATATDGGIGTATIARDDKGWGSLQLDETHRGKFCCPIIRRP